MQSCRVGSMANWPSVTRRSLSAAVPLWIQLSLPISLVIALSIGLIDFLNFHNYQKAYRQLSLARITVVGRDLREAIEGGLTIGLAPRNNAQLDLALAPARANTQGLRFAAIIDENAARVAPIGEIRAAFS